EMTLETRGLQLLVQMLRDLAEEPLRSPQLARRIALPFDVQTGLFIVKLLFIRVLQVLEQLLPVRVSVSRDRPHPIRNGLEQIRKTFSGSQDVIDNRNVDKIEGDDTCIRFRLDGCHDDHFLSASLINFASDYC